MAEISRSQTLRDNERIKHLAGTLATWANALVIAGFGTMGIDGKVEVYPILWILGGFWLIWMSSLGLTMLQAEGEM